MGHPALLHGRPCLLATVLQCETAIFSTKPLPKATESVAGKVFIQLLTSKHGAGALPHSGYAANAA